MADRRTISGFTFTLREHHLPRPGEHGEWVRYSCTACRTQIPIKYGESAESLLNRLVDHEDDECSRRRAGASS